ncbi:AraC family transcriptional regulator [Labrys miyagiensis]|uniref:AraC family transcriptional regulator n=1 Tax=Labrys miyagiensis TaxID=346912 RepID=A0ABQ6CTN2_9HYPH|nr:AraC family transcriptional regulator [Labrys miyagiensis]GLS23168.1 AraC family transcriptional regulator [Labrys miyagiensis]
MRPFLEKLTVPPDASWTLLNRRLDEGIPFEWHHHPEFELTLTSNSRGRRFIGDHIGAYEDGDLVLLGPNLPHTWFSEDKIALDAPHVALVMWFRLEWAAGLTQTFVEMRNVRALLDTAGRGIRFSGTATRRARPLIEAMPGLDSAARLLNLMQVLQILARDGEAEPLASPAYQAAAATPSDGDRIDRVLGHIHAHYHEDIRIADLAELSCLSISGFQRLFRRHTRLSVMDYVTQLRIGQACALLIGTQRPVAHVADEVGYRNLSNFNRQFLQVRGLTPREFRGAYRQGAGKRAARERSLVGGGGSMPV